MNEEAILVELKHIKESVNEIKTRFEKLEAIPVALKDIEHMNHQQDERIARAETAIERLEKALKEVGEKPLKDKAELVNTVMKYAGMAVLGGAVAFILSKVGVLFQ
jgi:DNA repair exonuclease SbcCD ATPase subunit